MLLLTLLLIPSVLFTKNEEKKTLTQLMIIFSITNVIKGKFTHHAFFVEYITFLIGLFQYVCMYVRYLLIPY